MNLIKKVNQKEYFLHISFGSHTDPGKKTRFLRISNAL